MKLTKRHLLLAAILLVCKSSMAAEMDVKHVAAEISGKSPTIISASDLDIGHHCHLKPMKFTRHRNQPLLPHPEKILELASEQVIIQGPMSSANLFALSLLYDRNKEFLEEERGRCHGIVEIASNYKKDLGSTLLEKTPLPVVVCGLVVAYIADVDPIIKSFSLWNEHSTIILEHLTKMNPLPSVKGLVIQPLLPKDPLRTWEEVLPLCNGYRSSHYGDPDIIIPPLHTNKLALVEYATNAVIVSKTKGIINKPWIRDAESRIKYWQVKEAQIKRLLGLSKKLEPKEEPAPTKGKKRARDGQDAR